MEINSQDILDEVHAHFMGYERALMENDVDALNDYFWNSELTLRYGPSECLYGHAAISAYRAARDVGDIRRTLEETRITCFGDSFAVANTEYVRLSSGRRGRQSQTWVRFGDGWKIVAAHVSLLDKG